jgi:hypothetical protein
LIPQLSPADIQQAIDLGSGSITQEEFGDEWRIPLAGGQEIVVTTPFARLTQAARQAAFRGEPLGDRQRQEAIERGRGKLQLLVTMFGPAPDFARWYQPILKAGNQEVKPSFTQNERTALRLEDGRFAARNVYVFPLEGLSPRGTVTLIVQHAVDKKEVLRTPIDLSKLR